MKRQIVYKLIGLGQYSRKAYPIFDDSSKDREDNCIKELRNEYQTIVRTDKNNNLLEVIESVLDEDTIINYLDSMNKVKW